MTKLKNTILCIAAFLMLNITLKAQLSGIYAVPGTYSSIGAAIADLNALGVSGAVTIQVAAGHTETAVSGGYTLNTITGASSTNSIVFEKSGSGANPIVFAYSGGTGTPGSAVQDGVWRFNGTDFVTVNGIDITDNNTTNPSTMEFGYGFFKASVTNGCQFNTIKNCVITLNRINNAGGSGPAVDGSRGIDIVNATMAAHTTAAVITASTGANSFNAIYSNTIQNCNYGISLIGYAAASPFILADFGNDIGGSSSSTGNTIINFGGGASTNPASGIRTLAQYNINVSYNTINNNNGSGVNHATTIRGIYFNTADGANITANSNTVTIKNNGTTTQVSGIETVSGGAPNNNTISISNNLITNCTNSLNTTGTFYGIWNSNPSTNLIITGNTFTNNTTNTGSGTVYMIYNNAPISGTINLNNNVIGGFVYTAVTSSAFNGIYNTAGGAGALLSINGNSFSGINHSSASSSTYSFITNGGATLTQTITNNTFNNLTLNTTGSVSFISNNVSMLATGSQFVSGNSIVGAFAKTGAGGILSLYYTFASSVAGAKHISLNNNFSNITITGATTLAGWVNRDGGSPSKTITANTFTNWSGGSSAVTGFSINFNGNNCIVNSNTVSNITGSGAIIGINYGASGTSSTNNTIFDNLIKNLTSGTSGGVVTGISLLASTSTSMSVYNNTISTLSSVGGVLVAGITSAATQNVFIYKNKIYDLQANNAGGSVNGVQLSAGSIANIYNNLIGDLRTPLANAANPLIGINISGGTNVNVLYNTVYLNATSSGALFGSSALQASTSPNLNLRNNILINSSSPNGAGLTVAYRRSSTTLTTYSASSNNNIFYAGTPTASNVIFTDGTASYSTLATYKAFMATRDAGSFTENTAFTSTVGSNSGFLHVNTSVASLAEGGGVNISGITDDIDGDIRFGNSGYSGSGVGTDIGADEFNGVGIDLAPPVINYTALSGACSTSDRTFTASITDLSGVPTSGILQPRVYFRKNSGSYVSTQGALSSGTSTNGIWSFTISSSAMGGLTSGDVVNYYVIAQDISGSAYITSNPSAGLVAVDVNSVTTNPTSPNSYIISSLSGTYTIGASGNYTTLTSAANAYNNSCLTGPVTYVLSDALYSTLETFPVIFQNNVTASSTNSLLIQPASGVAVTITPTLTSINSVIKFLDAKYITLDGLNTSGSSLTMNNSNVSSVSANIWLASSGTSGSGCNTIRLNNMALIGGYNSGSNGVIASIDGAVPSGTGGADNDNITISGNNFQRFFNGVLAVGTATVSSGGLDNWVITSNTIGPVASGTGNIGGSGVVLSSALNASITSNIVQNISTSSSNIYGLNLSNITGFGISQNTLTNLFSSTSSSGVNAIAGIYLGTSVNTGTIVNNNVNTIVNTNTGGYGARGVIINTGLSNSGINVIGNFISNIYSFVDASLIYWPCGIDLEGTTGGVNIYFNSISLSGSRTGFSTGATASAPIIVNSTGGNLNIRNNMLSNTFDNSSSTTDIAYAIYSAVLPSNFASIDYNNYHVGGTGNVPILAYSNTVSVLSLTALQTEFGGNLNSQNLLPTFTSTVDLHLPPNSNATLDNLGTPIAGITTDIDGQTRSGSTPDIGADEYTSPSCNGTPASNTVVASTSSMQCPNGTVSFSLTNTYSLTGMTYQWLASTTNSSTGFSTLLNATTTALSTTNIPSSSWFQCVVTCTNSGQSFTTSAAQILVNGPSSTITTAASVSTICPGQNANLSLSGSPSGVLYQWQASTTASNSGYAAIANATLSTSSQTNITSSTWYQAIISCSNSASYSIASTPALVSIGVPISATVNSVANNSVICSGQNITLSLTASASGVSYQWQASSTASNSGFTAIPNVTLATSTASNITVSSWYQAIVSCTSNTSFSIATNPTFVAVNTPSNLVTVVNPSITCPGQTASLSLTGTVSALSYTWMASTTGSNTGFAPIAGTQATNTAANVTVTTWYQAVVSCSSNPSFTVASSVSQSSMGVGTVSSAVSATFACSTKTINLSLSPATSSVSYQWFSSTTSSTSGFAAIPNATLATSPTTVGTSQTWYQAAISCTANTSFSNTSLPVTLSVGISPTSSITITSSTVCPGSTISLGGSSDIGTVYNWTGPNSFAAANAQNTSVNNVTLTASGVYSLTAVAGSCSTTATTAIFVQAVPVYSTTTSASPTIICSGSSSQFSASAYNPVNSYLFTTGSAALANTTGGTTLVPTAVDGTPSGSVSIGFTFNFNGVNYNELVASPDGWIKLGAGAGTALFTNNVTSTTNLPTIYPMWDDWHTGPTGYVRMLLTGSSPNRVLVIEWFVSGYASPAVAANSTYQTLLYETSNAIEFRYGTIVPYGSSSSGLTASATNFNCITFSNNSNSNGTANNANAIAPASGTSYMFTPPSLNYNWSPSGALSSSSGATVTATPTASGVYTLNTTNGCAALNTVTVNVVNPPSVNLVSTSTLLCGGVSATLSVTGANTYSWNTGSTSSSIVVTPTTNTTYSVSGVSAPCTTTSTANVLITASPFPTLSISGTPSICAGLNTTLTANGADTYSWNTSSTNTDIVVSPSANTTYTVVGTNIAGCSSSTTQLVSVFNNPTVTIAGSPSICLGQVSNLTANGAATYLWDSGATTNTISNAPTANTTYTVTGTNAAGCVNTTVQTVIVNATPTLSIVANNTVCSGQSLSLTASGAVTYTWNTGSNSASIAPSPTANVTYSVTGTNAFGCSSGTDQAVTAITSPTLSITGTPSICAGQTLNLTANGANTYTWSTGSNNAAIATTPTTTITYSVIGTNAFGCASGASQQATVYALPNLTVTGTNSICAGQTVNVSASGATTYTWDTGANTAAIATTPTSSLIYTVTGTDALGCVNFGTKAVTVNALPNVNISGSSGICTGQTATLIASGASTYTWNTGSNATSITDTPVINTSYTLIGTDALGCVNTSTQLVTVAASLSITIVGPSSICIGQTATLTGNGGVTYTWNTGATSESIAPSPTVTTSYTVIGASGTCSNTGVTTVSVNANPTVSISGNTVICSGQTTTLTGSGAVSYAWSSGDNTAAAALTPSVNSTYSLTGTNAFGCPDTKTVTVISNTLPAISIAQSAGIVCVNSPATFTASGAITYSWSTASNNTIVTITPTANTIYTVSGTNPAGCVSSSTVAIATNALPVLTITPASATICAFNTASFTASGATTYTWNSSVNNQTVAFTPSVSSVYTLTGLNSSGCVSSTTLGITTNALPVLTVTPVSATICVGQTTTLTGSGAATYSWNTGAATASVALSPTVNTTYTLTGTSGFGCVSTITSAVVSNSLPVIGIAQSANTVCSGSAANFTASGATSYTWSTASNNSSITVTPTVASVYTVSGTNPAGCVSTSTVALATNSLPILSIVPASATVCSLSQATFNANGANTYTWNGSISGQTVAFTPTTSSTYTLSGTNTLGCTSSTTLGVTTNSLPVLNVTPASLTVCALSQASFVAAGATTFTWNNTVASSSIATNPSVSATYTVRGDSPQGCRGTQTVALTVNALPVLTISPSSATVCPSTAITFTGSGANSYTWSTSTPVNTSTVSITPTVAASYTLTGLDVNGCVSTKTVLLATYVQPTVSISPASATVCMGSVASFTANGANSYTWQNTQVSVTYTDAPTTNTVYNLVATSLNGCIGTATVGVSTNSLPVVSISPASATVCNFSSLNFTASGANTYTWNNSVQGVSVTLFQSGNSTHTVVGTNALGCSSSATVAVTTNSLPIIVISPSLITACALDVTTLTASGAATYSWATGSTAANTTVNPSSTTAYTVLGTDALGCSSVGNAVVVTNTLPVLSVTPANATVCALSPLTLTASGANTYTWSTTAIGSTAVVSPSASLTYTVIGTETATGCKGSMTVAVVARTLPVLNIVTSNTAVCDGSSATMTVSGANTYTWSGSTNDPTLVVTPTATSVYTASGTDGFGCSSSSTLTIVLNPLPNVVVTPSAQTICLDEVATYSVSGALNYTWMPGNVTANVYTITAPVSVSFYSVTGTDANNCSNVGSFALTVSGCVGLNETTNVASLITVFPNPSAGLITAKFEFEGRKQILISDGIGRVIEMRMSENQSEEFDLSKYAKGVYYVKVNSKTASANFKISVQ